jgi:hypothetical protein
MGEGENMLMKLDGGKNGDNGGGNSQATMRRKIQEMMRMIMEIKIIVLFIYTKNLRYVGQFLHKWFPKLDMTPSLLFTKPPRLPPLFYWHKCISLHSYLYYCS